MQRSFARNSFEAITLLLLRCTLGYIMLHHGMGKTVEGFAVGLTKMGIPFPEISAQLAIGAEIYGGWALILGLFTPIAALAVAITMGVASFMAHATFESTWELTWLYSWFGITDPNHPKFGMPAFKQGFQFPITLMFVALYLVFRGAGALSIDGFFRWAIWGRRKNPPPVVATPIP